MSVDVMIDLETLGTGNRAAIVQIGAAAFDVDRCEVVATHSSSILFQSAVKHGDVDGRTIEWWLDQSQEARAGLLGDGRVSLPEALARLSSWFSAIGPVHGVWSHATFDAVILRSAYDTCGKLCPWTHGQTRDLRTLHSLHYPGPRERSGVPHNALDDALHQCTLAMESIRAIREAVGADHAG